MLLTFEFEIMGKLGSIFKNFDTSMKALWGPKSKRWRQLRCHSRCAHLISECLNSSLDLLPIPASWLWILWRQWMVTQKPGSCCPHGAPESSSGNVFYTDLALAVAGNWGVNQWVLWLFLSLCISNKGKTNKITII